MELAKLWLPIAGIFLSVAGLFTFRHFELGDKANNEMLNARVYLENAQQTLEDRSASWNTLNAALNDFNQAKTRLEKSASGKEIAESKQRLVEGDLAYLVKSMPALVEKVRAAAVGTTVPEMTLNNFKVLKNAQIKKIEDTGISLIHSEGFGVVPIENLPAALLEQFDLGHNTLVKKIEKLAESIKAPSSGKSEPIVEPTPVEAVSKPAAPSAGEVKLQSIQLKLAEMNAQALAMRVNIESLEKNAVSYGYQASSAISRGVPSTRFRIEEQKALAQAAQIKQQLLILNASFNKLKVEEQFVKLEGTSK